MTSITWRLWAATMLIVSASFVGDASAQTLVQTSAAGACSPTSSAVAHTGGSASNASGGATLSCGIDVAVVDIDDIGSAEVFVVDVSAVSNAWGPAVRALDRDWRKHLWRPGLLRGQ